MNSIGQAAYHETPSASPQGVALGMLEALGYVGG